jgi:hypothetical protein
MIASRRPRDIRGGAPIRVRGARAYAAQQRFACNTGGLVYNGIPINTDHASQLHVSTLAQYAATLPKGNAINFTQDSVAYPITAGDAINIFNQMGGLVQQARTIEAQCYAAIDAGTMTTYDQVDAAFASSMKAWKDGAARE